MTPRACALVAALGLFAAVPTTAADELTLEGAVRAATAHNERTALAEQARVASHARIAEARALFLPQLTVTGTYTRRAYESVRQVGGVNVTIQSLNALASNATLGVTLFDARSFPLYRQALREDEATAARSANDVRLLGFEVASAYLTALGQAQVAKAAQERLQLARATLDVARARFAAQLVRSNDVTKAELEQATAEQALTQAQGDLTSAYLQLGFLLGERVEGPLAEPRPLLDAAAVPAPEPRTLIRSAQTRRLDVVADRRHAEALRDAAHEPLMRYLPSLGVIGQVRTTNETGLSGHNPDWSIAGVLTWHLFDGGEALGEHREKSALAASAELETHTLLRQVELDVERATVELESSQAAVAQASAALDAARKNARETDLLYRQGLVPALDVASANAGLFDAQVAAIRARYTLGLAYLDLRAAQGFDALGEEPRP